MLNSGFPRGGCYYICKQSWFGVLFTLGQSIQPRPKQRLSKRNPSCSPVRCSDCLHVPVAPQCPLSRADVQWVVLVRVPLWVDSLYKVWFNVKHEWVFDLVSRAEITAHSFVQPLHQCFCFSLTSFFLYGKLHLLRTCFSRSYWIILFSRWIPACNFGTLVCYLCKICSSVVYGVVGEGGGGKKRNKKGIHVV